MLQLKSLQDDFQRNELNIDGCLELNLIHAEWFTGITCSIFNVRTCKNTGMVL